MMMREQVYGVTVNPIKSQTTVDCLIPGFVPRSCPQLIRMTAMRVMESAFTYP